uniref:Transcription factor TBF1-like n=1 Tax=Polistes dominula TaxID=743375 RepID=A0ABM1J7G9_POLDO
MYDVSLFLDDDELPLDNGDIIENETVIKDGSSMSIHNHRQRSQCHCRQQRERRYRQQQQQQQQQQQHQEQEQEEKPDQRLLRHSQKEEKEEKKKVDEEEEEEEEDEEGGRGGGVGGGGGGEEREEKKMMADDMAQGYTQLIHQVQEPQEFISLEEFCPHIHQETRAHDLCVKECMASAFSILLVLVNGHTVMKTQVLVRSLKLSITGHG